MQGLVEYFFDIMVAASLSLPRFLVALYFIPLFGFTQIPISLRLAMVIGLTLPITAGLVANVDHEVINFLLLPMLIIKEAIIGFFLGFIIAIPFWVFQSMGALIDNQRGALSAGYLNPASGPDASMLGDLLSKVIVILFIQMGIFAALIKILVGTYKIWPPLAGFPDISPEGYEVFINQFSHLVKSFILYAGPIVLVLLLTESAFAILGAYSPQLQVYFMAMPAKSLIALIIIVLYLSQVVTLMQQEGDNVLLIPDILKGIFNESLK